MCCGRTPIWLGTTPFLTEFDANGVVYFSREYLVPQNNATILTPTDMLSSFVDNHGRSRSPTVALPMTSDSIPGYGLHGYRSEPGGVSNGVETNGIAQSTSFAPR